MNLNEKDDGGLLSVKIILYIKKYVPCPRVLLRNRARQTSFFFFFFCSPICVKDSFWKENSGWNHGHLLIPSENVR